MARRLRTILFWFVVAFLVYAIFNSPDQAAAIVRAAFDGLARGVAAIGDFFDALLAAG